MRLIDADDLGVGRCSKDVFPAAYCAGWNGLLGLIVKAPTVYAVPVVHGRWKCHGDCGVTECSVCGWSIEEYVGDYAYCPECGARMDGGSENG